MKKSRIVQIDDREIEIVDVSEDLEVVDEMLVFDKILFDEKSVKKLVKLFLNELKRREKRFKFFKTKDFKLKCSFEDYLNEEINEVYDDLDYLVTFLSL